METNSIWESMASRYDTEDRKTIAKIIAKEVRSKLQDTKEKTALDYGCGTGLIGFELIDLFQSLLFADPSAQMIEQVNRKISSEQVQNVSAICCDFLQEVPTTIKADYIIMSQVLLHIQDSRSILTKLYEVLNEGGHLMIIDFDKNERVVSDKVHNGFEPHKLIDLLKQIGFTSATAQTFYHGEKIFMNQDASLFLLDAVK